MIKIYIFVVVFWASTLAIPHPIQRADNSTRCRFFQLPTGYLAKGKTVSVPGECMMVTCEDDLTISGLTCPTYDPKPGCEVSPVNYFKEYPDCCPVMLCTAPEYRARRRQAKRGRRPSS